MPSGIAWGAWKDACASQSSQMIGLQARKKYIYKLFVTNLIIFTFMFSSVRCQDGLTSSAWEKWLKRFSDNHRIHHCHVAMIKGIIYTNLVIFVSLCGMRAFRCEYSKFIFSYSQMDTHIFQGLTNIAKLVYNIPFIIAIWKWWILNLSPNLFSHFSHAKLLKQAFVRYHGALIVSHTWLLLEIQ